MRENDVASGTVYMQGTGDRPINGDRFATALGDAGIQPACFGNTTLWIHSTDALYPRSVPHLAALYS